LTKTQIPDNLFYCSLEKAQLPTAKTPPFAEKYFSLDGGVAVGKTTRPSTSVLRVGSRVTTLLLKPYARLPRTQAHYKHALQVSRSQSIHPAEPSARRSSRVQDDPLPLSRTAGLRACRHPDARGTDTVDAAPMALLGQRCSPRAVRAGDAPAMSTASSDEDWHKVVGAPQPTAPLHDAVEDREWGSGRRGRS